MVYSQVKVYRCLGTGPVAIKFLGAVSRLRNGRSPSPMTHPLTRPAATSILPPMWLWTLRQHTSSMPLWPPTSSPPPPLSPPPPPLLPLPSSSSPLPVVLRVKYSASLCKSLWGMKVRITSLTLRDSSFLPVIVTQTSRLQELMCNIGLVNCEIQGCWINRDLQIEMKRIVVTVLF